LAREAGYASPTGPGLSSLIYEIDEVIKYRRYIMGPGAGFRVSLESECGPVGAMNPL
jgi:hypothetical protein